MSRGDAPDLRSLGRRVLADVFDAAAVGVLCDALAEAGFRAAVVQCGRCRALRAEDAATGAPALLAWPAPGELGAPLCSRCAAVPRY